MRESRTYGSVRGALSNGRPYRDRFARNDGKSFARKDGKIHLRILAARCARVVQGSFAPKGERRDPKRGRGECRVPVAPAAARVE
jgi:predicted RNA-binding Zn ribbon-like protein